MNNRGGLQSTISIYEDRRYQTEEAIPYEDIPQYHLLNRSDQVTNRHSNSIQSKTAKYPTLQNTQSHVNFHERSVSLSNVQKTPAMSQKHRVASASRYMQFNPGNPLRYMQVPNLNNYTGQLKRSYQMTGEDSMPVVPDSSVGSTRYTVSIKMSKPQAYQKMQMEFQNRIENLRRSHQSGGSKLTETSQKQQETNKIELKSKMMTVNRVKQHSNKIRIEDQNLKQKNNPSINIQIQNKREKNNRTLVSKVATTGLKMTNEAKEEPHVESKKNHQRHHQEKDKDGPSDSDYNLPEEPKDKSTYFDRDGKPFKQGNNGKPIPQKYDDYGNLVDDEEAIDLLQKQNQKSTPMDPVPKVTSKLQIANQQINEMIDNYFQKNCKPRCLQKKENMEQLIKNIHHQLLHHNNFKLSKKNQGKNKPHDFIGTREIFIEQAIEQIQKNKHVEVNHSSHEASPQHSPRKIEFKRNIITSRRKQVQEVVQSQKSNIISGPDSYEYNVPQNVYDNEYVSQQEVKNMIKKIDSRVNIQYKDDSRSKSVLKAQTGLRQTNSLNNYQKYQQIWEKQKNFLSTKTSRHENLLDSSDNFMEQSGHKRIMSAVQSNNAIQSNWQNQLRDTSKASVEKTNDQLLVVKKPFSNMYRTPQKSRNPSIGITNQVKDSIVADFLSHQVTDGIVIHGQNKLKMEIKSAQKLNRTYKVTYKYDRFEEQFQNMLSKIN